MVVASAVSSSPRMSSAFRTGADRRGRGGSGRVRFSAIPSPRRIPRGSAYSHSRPARASGRCFPAPPRLMPISQVGRWPVRGVLVEGRHGIIGHAVEVIVFRIVLPHMGEAETGILPFRAASLGARYWPGSWQPGCSQAGASGGAPASSALAGFDPDAVEQGVISGP